ncbi:MAG: S41 family peptidase [Turicibacter sp.]|nr:S41 family peptidase [Turicibacter sp.]
MKKISILLMSILVLAVLVACSGDVEPVELKMEIEQVYAEVEQPIEYSDVEFVGLEIEPEQTAEDSVDRADQFTTEDFLYDIAFLLRNLEENFPFFGVIERLFDISDPLDTFRNYVLYDADNLSYLDFRTRLEDGFWMLGGVAHLDFNHPAHSWSIDTDSWSNNEPLETPSRIIKEDRIALIMTPPDFFDHSSSPARAMQETQDFIRGIQGYEHVIIDLRHIGGGWLDNFINTFVSPNISEPLSFYEFAFITDGEIAQQTHRNLYRPNNPNLFFLRDVVTPLVSADLFVEQHNFLNINADDLENLAYGFLLETFIQPTSGNLRLPLLADNIWLLIGPNNWSAAEITGRVAKEAGFTLVGEQTSYRNSWGRRNFLMPRTRYPFFMDTFYVTDDTGRNIEEFPLEPHYFNRPDMDALETVLSIIAERSE